MESTNVIKTLFEYTSNGYEEAAKNAADLLAKIAALKKEETDLERLHGQAATAVNKLVSEWTILNKTMGAGTSKEVREHYAQLPKMIEAATAAQAKATAQTAANAKTQAEATKAQKEATTAAETYQKVSNELAKGLDNAAVSTDALAKAKKHLNAELRQTDVGTERYTKLSEEMAKVTKASNDIAAAQKKQVKEIGIAEDSVAALRLRVAELNKEWLAMSRNDPGFKAKADELKMVTTELTAAENEVGIFSRGVGGYSEQIKTLIPEFMQLGEGMGLLGPVGQIAQKGIKGVTTAFRALMSNPIVMFFTGIVLAVKAFDFIADKIATKTAKKFTEAVEQSTAELKRNSDELAHNVNMLRARGATTRDVADAELAAVAEVAIAAKDTYAKFLAEYDNMGRRARKKAKETLDGLKSDMDAANLALEAGVRQHEVAVAAEQTKARQDAQAKAKADQDKAKSEQDKANADYIKAMQGRMKAAEDVAKAEADGETELAEHLRDILAVREADLEVASKKRLTLSQLEKDELELAEYQHQKAFEAIQNEADDKRAEAEAKKTDNYLKALADVRAAQISLLEAQKRGNADEIALYQQYLAMKTAALAKYNADEIILNDEQRLTEDMAALAHQQKMIEDYKALQTTIGELQNQYAEAQTQTQREAIQKQIDLTNAQVAAQAQALQALGVETSAIQVEAVATADTSQQYITDALAKSLGVIEQFAGKSKNSFFKVASSISALVGKAFDIGEIRKKYGDDAEGIKAANKEIAQSMSELGAAVAISGLNAVTDSITQNLEAEKSAIDEMFAYQEERAQSSYDKQSADLKAALNGRNISETKYRLEQMKLNDKKAKEDKQREKDKANALYAVELKQFNVDKAKSASMAVIATALGIMQGYAQTGPIAGSVFAAIVGALGAVQVAAILSQKPPAKPKFEKGGGIRFEGIEGASHAGGGVPISFGNKVVAEAEGDEGALIISKKAMKNPYMRRLLSFVEAVGADISGSQSEAGKFAEGGELNFKDYDEDFFQPARNGLTISGRRKRSIVINGKKVKLKAYGFNADAAIDAAADDIAIPLWNEYIGQEQAKLDARNAEIEAAVKEGIGQSEALKSMGVTDLNSYNQTVEKQETDLKYVENTIKAYEELANSRINALKEEMKYEEQLADFEKQRGAAAEELAQTTEEFNKRVLRELLDSGQITVEEYESYLDQIVMKYGASVNDIIALKKKQVNAVISAISEQRAAEIASVQASFDAFSSGGGDPYEEAREKFVSGVIDDITDINRLIGEMTDEEEKNLSSVIALARELEKLDQQYRDNETALADGVVSSREERQKLIEEQRTLTKEIDLKTEELERTPSDAGGGSEAVMSAEALEQKIADINKKYDEQEAIQQDILNNLGKEIDDAQLLHDKKLAYIKAEEDALKESFDRQKAEIEAWLADATAGLRSEAAGLAQAIAAIRVAGLEAGMNEYGKAADALNEIIGSLEATGGKKYATGGAIEMGSGLFQVSGPSHSQGGVPVSVGGTKIAEVEGVEKMFAVNKLAAQDPEMLAALARASDVNARYTGVPLLDSESASAFALDYDLLAAKIGAQINARPVETFITHRKIEAAYGITQAHKKASFMK